MSKRYEVIPARRWQHPDGRTASLYGATPGDGFVLTMVGWTVQDLRTGTVGIGRKPWESFEDACKWVDAQNARMMTRVG